MTKHYHFDIETAQRISSPRARIIVWHPSHPKPPAPGDELRITADPHVNIRAICRSVHHLSVHRCSLRILGRDAWIPLGHRSSVNLAEGAGFNSARHLRRHIRHLAGASGQVTLVTFQRLYG